MKPKEEIYAESLFIDSGAHTLYNVEVLKHSKKKGKTGRTLARPPVRWSQGDFSYFDLSKGTPFRAYCDDYAEFMKWARAKDPEIILANVDAISNPEKTWEIQSYFEQEHGVSPVPIVHFGTPMKWVDKYVGQGIYSLLGVGGLGQGITRHGYVKWGDEFFNHICPEHNDFMPMIRTHGFAMTSWELMCRWPWWSVDSATWVKLSAYGWLYVPRWSEDRWRYDMAPLMVNFSDRPPKEKEEDIEEIEGFMPEGRKSSPREKEKGKHFRNATNNVKDTCKRWLEHINIPLGSLNARGEMIEMGVTSHHRARSIANLLYLKGLEGSRPKWPHPLDPSLVRGLTVKYEKGLGL